MIKKKRQNKSMIIKIRLVDTFWCKGIVWKAI